MSFFLLNSLHINVGFKNKTFLSTKAKKESPFYMKKDNKVNKK